MALPSIQRDLGFSQSGLAWVVNAYLIDVGAQLAEGLPNGRHCVLEGQEHVVPPEVLVPVLGEFFAG